MKNYYLESLVVEQIETNIAKIKKRKIQMDLCQYKNRIIPMHD